MVNVGDDGDVSYFHDDALPENADEWVSVDFFKLQRYYNSAEGTNDRKRLRINSQ